MANQPTKYSKFLVGAASAALVATAVAPVASAADFKDTKGNTHEEAIKALSAAGVISGYADGTFKPNKTLTRSDVVKMMGKWLVSEGYKVPTDYKTNVRFTDLKSTSNDELLQYAAVVKDNGVFIGSNDRLLAGDDISRENMAVVIVRAFDRVHDIDLASYVAGQDFKKDVTDLGKAKAEARPAIDVLDFFDITNPAAPAFNPKATTTRGQFASFLNKTLTADFSKVTGQVAEGVASVKAVNATTVEVTFKDAVSNLNSLNFKIDGLTVSNAAVKQTGDNKTVVLTTAIQKAGEKYTVTLNEKAIGNFVGASSVLPEKISMITTSQQGVVGNQVTVRAQLTVAKDESKAEIPVTFNIVSNNKSINKDHVVEVKTNADGIAEYSYTQYAAAVDDVQVYATGKANVRSTGKVYWATKAQLTITDITEATTLVNGSKKVYEINSTNFKGGYVFVAFKGNLNVTPDKVVKGITAEGNGVHLLGSNGAPSISPVLANKYPYLSSLGSEQVIAVKLDANGKANLVLTGANASAIPVVYEGTLLANATGTNPHTVLSNYDARYNELEVQAVGTEVKFDRVVKYGLTLKAEGVRDAALSTSDGKGGRDYVATYTKEDGKPVSVGTTVYVAIPRVGLTGANFVLLNEDGDAVPQATGTDANHFVYALTTDKDGKVTFTVTADKAEAYVQPITFINDNRTGTTTFFDKDDTQATDDYTYFTNVVNYASGLKLVTDTGKKQASYSLNEAANFTYSLVDQNGKTRKANKNTVVTFNVSNGEGVTTVNGSRVEAHDTKQVTLPLAAGATSVNVRVVASSPSNVSVYATTSQSGETFLPTETLNATFTQYAQVTGITGHTNASLLSKANRTFDLVATDGKVYTYAYDATNIRQNNSTVDIATFEALIAQNAKITVAKDADGKVYYNVVETGTAALIPAQATINKLIADGVTTISNTTITAAGGTVPTSTDNITINSGAANLTVNLDAKHLTVNAPNAATVDITGNYTDLTVNANLAHVVYTGTSTVSGTTTINAASTASFVVDTAATVANVVINDTDGVKFTNNGTVTGTVTIATASPVVIDGSTATALTVVVKPNLATANIVAPANTRIEASDSTVVTAKQANGTVIPTVSVNAEEAVKAEALKITSLEVAQDATNLVLPTVANGYSVAIKSSSITDVIAVNGTITPTTTATIVDVVLTVSKGEYKADTKVIKVLVPMTSAAATQKLAATTFKIKGIKTGNAQTKTVFADLNNVISNNAEAMVNALNTDDALELSEHEITTLTAALKTVKLDKSKIVINKAGDFEVQNGFLSAEAVTILKDPAFNGNPLTGYNITLISDAVEYTITIQKDGSASIAKKIVK